MKFRKYRAGIIVVLAIVLSYVSAVLPVQAAPAITPEYTLQQKQRISRTEFEYTYKASLTASDEAIQSATAKVTSTSANTQIIEGSLSFGTASANSTVESTDTFTLRQNRGVAFDPDALQWSIVATLEDVTPPVISLHGDSPATVILNSTYEDAGATALDNVDGPVTVTTSGSVDTSTVDTYTLTYTATDAAGNQATAERFVSVITNDSTARVVGIVQDKSGTPLAGVTIAILNRSDYGSNTTNAEGKFTFPVDGGEALVVTYHKAGYLPVQRKVDIPEDDWVAIDPVAMSAVDTVVTLIDLSNTEEPQVHHSSTTDDERGERTTGLVFDGITEATVTAPDGSTQVLTGEIGVRASEFDQPDTMPAELPDNTAFTFATALTIDGVDSESEVTFDQPVILYLDNFLGFGVGEIVPVGYYNEKTAEWDAYDNGVVVKLLDSDNDGTVDGLDSDGDDSADDLNGNGSTGDEVNGIAGNPQYAANKTYWRAAIPHFSTWDLNYGSGAKLTEDDQDIEDDRDVDPETEEEPDPKTDDSDKTDDKSCGASYVDVQSQVYHEDIKLAGTDLTLNYASDRVTGYRHIISAQISGDTLPSELIEIIARLEVAGKVYTQTFAAAPNQSVEFIWDGLDFNDKLVEGTVRGQLRIGYKYQAYYFKPPYAQQSFGLDGSEFTDVAANPVTKWKTESVTIAKPANKQMVAEGWTLSDHHHYARGAVMKGDGTQFEGTLALGDGLVAYYRFEGDADDSSGANHHGITHGTVDYSEGKIGKAANFYNYLDLLELPNESLDQTTESTVSLWVKFTETGSSVGILSAASNTSPYANDYLIFTSNGFVQPHIQGNDVIGLKRIDDLAYHLITVVTTPEGLKTYIDGVFDSELNGPFAPLSIDSKIWLGNDQDCVDGCWSRSQQFEGSLDELRIYDRALSEKEIATLYESEGGAIISENKQVYKVPNSSETYLFDLDGKHLQTLETNTETVLQTFEYDDEDRLISIQDRFGNTTEVKRDAAGVVTAIHAPDRQITRLTVDSNQHLTAVTYDDNSSYQFDYNSGGLMTVETEPNGNIFGHEFDANGRITRVTDGLGGSKTYSKQSGQYVVETALGNRKTIAMTGLDKQTTSPSGLQRTVTYADDGNTKTVNRCGTSTQTTYTTEPKTGREVVSEQTLTLPGGQQLTRTLDRTYLFNDDETVQVRTVAESLNSKTTVIQTDYQTGLTTTVSPAGRVTQQFFDVSTLLPSKNTLPELEDTTYSYDARGRLVVITTGERQQQMAYDGRGNVSTLTDEEGRVTLLSYDALDRLQTMTSPTGAVQQFHYDANGNMTTFTTPNSNTHQFTYNAVNKKATDNSPLSSTTRYAYDAERKLTKVTYPSGQSRQYIYENSLLSRIETPEGNREYIYNCDENPTLIKDGSEAIAYRYDGSLLKGMDYTGVLEQSIDMSYDDDFRMSTLTYAGGSENHAYDADALLVQRGEFALLRHTGNGLPLAVENDHLKVVRSYNTYAELLQSQQQVNGSDVFSYSLSRDKTGRILSKTEVNAGESSTYSYQYDDDGRLLGVNKEGAIVETYAYDANGHRVGASINADDQVLSYQGVSYEYNPDGYLTKKQDAGDTTTYHYGIWGELKQVNLPDGTVISYQHNTKKQRIAKLVDGEITERYLWLDLTTLLAVYDKDDQLLMRFNYADGRMPLSMDKAGQRYYLHYDQVGTLKLVTDADGNPVKQLDYDSYGQLLSDSDPAFTVPFGFAGGLQDRDTGLTRFGYRDYDAVTGRWTAKDPIGFAGGDSNLYGYVLGDPVNFVDPTGEIIPILWGGIKVGGGMYLVYKGFEKVGEKAGISGLNDPNPRNRCYGGVKDKIVDTWIDSLFRPIKIGIGGISEAFKEGLDWGSKLIKF